MKKTILKLVIAIFIGAITISSCNKEEARPNPTMTFLSGDGYTSSDVTLAAGDTVIVGLDCNWNGTDLLTSINLYFDDVLNGTFTFNPAGENGVVTSKLTKTGADSEKYTFELVDANGQKTSISITLTKETTGAEIDLLTGVTIGAQKNASIGSFYSLSNNTTYNQADALTNETIIDFVCAYDVDNNLFLASPGANLTNIAELDFSGWTTLNETYYCKMNITTDQFDYIDSDKYIVESFDGFSTDDRKRKAKSLKTDDVYVFKTQSGKYGILKVNSVTSSDVGSVTFDVKIQH